MKTRSGNSMALFLYGTLRSGGNHHHLIAPYMLSAVSARIWGRLYHVPEGYPALEVPADAILTRGTAQPEVDAAVEVPARAELPKVQGDWGWVQGEVVEVSEPRFSLPPVDLYEDFRHGVPCLFERVLVFAETAEGARAVWTYIKSPSAVDIRIPSGIWPAHDAGDATP